MEELVARSSVVPQRPSRLRDRRGESIKKYDLRSFVTSSTNCAPLLCLSVCLRSTYLSASLPVPVCLSSCLSLIPLPACLPAFEQSVFDPTPCLPACLSICCLSVCLSVFDLPVVCLPALVCLSSCLSVLELPVSRSLCRSLCLPALM